MKHIKHDNTFKSWSPRVGSTIYVKHDGSMLHGIVVHNFNSTFTIRLFDDTYGRLMTLQQCEYNEWFYDDEHNEIDKQKILLDEFVLRKFNDFKITLQKAGKYMKGGDGNDLTENVNDYAQKNNLEQDRLYLLDEYILQPNMNKLFVEDTIDNIVITDDVLRKLLPTKEERLQLLDIVNNSYSTNESDKMLVANENVTIYNLITINKHMIDEGNKLIQWLNTTFSDGLIKGMRYEILNGYVVITRDGILSYDIISQNLLGSHKLSHFKWQLDKPIDYATLKYILFHNKFQKGLTQDMDQQKEAELILSQEYIVALQPVPIYQLFILKRLILCWYGDKLLEENIRKIKILINQYRSVNNKEYNKINGVLASIMIYPRYGYKSVRTVTELLSKYFAHYITLGWVGSDPHYFIKKDELMYITNGALDLKLYYRHVLSDSNASLNNDSFNTKFTKILGSKNMFSNMGPQ